MVRHALLLAALLAAPVAAQDRARVGAGSDVDVGRGAAEIVLELSQPVPWRVGLRAEPWRLVVDLSEGDFSALAPGDLGTGVVWGRLGPGVTRLLVPLPGPMGVEAAWMETGPDTTLRIELDADAPAEIGADLAVDPPMTAPARANDGPLVIALDPGHGGIDPGAERGGAREADLMLRFAGELAALLRERGHEVVLTRRDDSFVDLRGRATLARRAGADLLVSLHADAIEGEGASGATVYTLGPDAEDALTRELTRRQARDDILRGADLGGAGDAVAGVLIDLARVDTAHRSQTLARALLSGIEDAGLGLHKRPRLGAAFTVLKSPDVPSVLLELGFMSDPDDLRNLLNRDWRARMAHAVVRGIEAWAAADAAEATLRRR